MKLRTLGWEENPGRDEVAVRWGRGRSDCWVPLWGTDLRRNLSGVSNFNVLLATSPFQLFAQIGE